VLQLAWVVKVCPYLSKSMAWHSGQACCEAVGAKCGGVFALSCPQLRHWMRKRCVATLLHQRYDGFVGCAVGQIGRRRHSSPVCTFLDEVLWACMGV
jgi:hypothetical protein